MKQLKKMLKNNKGVTLVELIISTAILFLVITAFLSMVGSATKMFNRGQRELDVQDEAQIVTNQIESLLSDAHLYAGQVGNEVFIVNEDYVHVVSQTNDGVYYTIYNFPAAQEATTENVKDLLTNDPGSLKVNTYMGRSLLSKRMTNLTLDNSKLDDDNVVELSMTYKNQEREIPVSQSIFLRNKPGSDGNGHGNSNTDNDFDAELVVLRYKRHNLKTEFGVTGIKKNGSSAVISGADAGKYDIDVSTGTIALKNSVAKDAASAGGATITCVKGGQDYKIRLSFDPCTVGIQTTNNTNQVVSLRSQNVEQANDYIAIKGFDTHSTDVYYTVSLQISPNYTFTSGSTLSTSRYTSSGGQLPAQGDLEGDKQFAGGGYYKGVYRLMLDNQSNHLIFRQLSQCDRVERGGHGNKPVPIYTIKVEHKKSDGTFETLGTTQISVNIPNSSLY